MQKGYYENKTVFVVKNAFVKSLNGINLYIYIYMKSKWAKAYTEWVNIIFIEKINHNSISKKHGTNLMNSTMNSKNRLKGVKLCLSLVLKTLRNLRNLLNLTVMSLLLANIFMKTNLK